MDDGLQLVLALFLLLGVIGLAKSQYDKAKQTVIEYLVNIGFQEIEVSKLKWGGLLVIFATKYKDLQGSKAENSCVVTFNYISVDKIYWEKPL